MQEHLQRAAAGTSLTLVARLVPTGGPAAAAAAVQSA
jgi:hypothetical protein